MKIKNNNTYALMFGMDFIQAGEVKEVPADIAKLLLKQPNVEEYVTKQQVKNLEDENAALKGEILEQLKAQAEALGIKYQKNIGIDKLKAKIAEAQK